MLIFNDDAIMIINFFSSYASYSEAVINNAKFNVRIWKLKRTKHAKCVIKDRIVLY